MNVVSANSVAEVRRNRCDVSTIMPPVEILSKDSTYTPMDSVSHKLVAVEIMIAFT